ncbi:MAG: TonB C-terminal domain-containing protein, partial [Burkholderiales bacterium]
MNAATLSRDPFMPQAPKVRGRAIALAVAAHVLLILGLMFSVNWGSEEPATVAAELWSATPQAAAPRAVEPPPPPEVKKVEPVVKPTPKPPEPVVAAKPPTPALPDPQIAIEKAKKEDAKRVAAEQEEARQLKREKAEREKQELAQKKLEKDKADKAKAEQAKADAAKNEKAEKAEAARLAAIRDQNLKRMAGLQGATGGSTDTGTALRSSAPSANYAGRVMARIKPNILLTDPVDGNPRAVVEVKLAPDGTIIAKRLVQSS